MGIIIRESLKTSVVNYVGVLIGTVNVLFLYNKLLTTEEYGLYAILISFPVVGAGFINLGVPHVAVRFFNRFEDAAKKHHGILTFLLFTPLAGFLLFLLAFYGFRGLFETLYSESPALITYSWVLPLLTFSVLYQSVLEAYCRSHLKIVIPTVIREIYLKLSNSFLVIGYYLNWFDFSGLVLGLALVYILALLLLLGYIKKLKRLFLVWDWSVVRSPIFPEIVRYGLWTMAGGAAATALPHLEKLILPMFTDGLTQTAIFTIALNIAIVISIPRNTIASISDPILARAWARGDTGEVQTIYTKSALNLGIIGLFLFLGVWCNIDSIFEVIPNPDKYRAGKYVVLLIGLANVFDMATGLNSELLKNSVHYRVEFFLFIFRFVLLTIANIIFIPLWGYNGAAFAILVSTVLYNLAKYVFIWRKLGMQPFGRNTVLMVLLALLAYMCAVWVDWHEGGGLLVNALEMGVKGLVIVVIFGGGVWLTGISPDLNSTLKRARERVIIILFKR